MPLFEVDQFGAAAVGQILEEDDLNLIYNYNANVCQMNKV